MNKKKYTDPNYTPDANTLSEIELLNKEKQDLSNFHLKGAELENIYLVDAVIKKSDLSKANFKNASMFGADLSDSNLFKANLENANLNNANLENCNLLGANLLNTKLKNVNWGKDSKVINEIEAEKAYKNGDVETALEKYNNHHFNNKSILLLKK